MSVGMMSDRWSRSSLSTRLLLPVRLTYSHGAGGDHLAKYGLFSMLLLPVRATNSVALGLDGLDLSTHVPSYKAADAFVERSGLAFVLGHCQSIEPETA